MNKKTFILSALIANLTFAQSIDTERASATSEKTIDEVVMTGVSKKMFVKDNPLPIKRLSAKTIDKTSESNIIDAIVQNTPGLVAVKTGPNISKPFIRGLGYNRVLTLFDNHRQEGQQWGDEHGIEIDNYNISQVEVIKGPSSLMYGSDAIAGIISFFPYIPQKENSESLKAVSEFQSNNNLIGAGFRWAKNTNGWQIATSTSLRFAGNYQNSVDGKVYNTGFNEKNFALLLGHQKENDYTRFQMTYYDNEQGIPDGSRNPKTGKFTKQVFDGDDDIVDDRPVVSKKELNSYSLSPLHQRIRHFRAYINNQYDVNWATIRADVGFQQNNREEYNHPLFPSQAGMYVRLNTLNYNFNIIPKSSTKLELSFGANGMLQNNKNKNATDFPIPDYNLADVGLFAFAKWQNERWNVSGGLRYDYRNLNWDNLYLAENPENRFDQQVTSATPNAQQQFEATKKNFSGLSASIGTSYKINTHLYAKANIGRAYRAPNITELASNGLDPGAHIVYLGNKNFKPEFSFQQDLSLIASYQDFSGEINVFNNNISDYIYLTMSLDSNGSPLVDSQGNRTYQYQQTKAQLWGWEAFLSLHPKTLKGWTFNNSFSFVRGLNKNIIYKNQGINGEYLPLISPFKWLSRLEKNINLQNEKWKSLSIFFETDYNAAQNRFLGLNGTETATLAYLLLNAGISTEWKFSQKQNLSLSFQVNNITDKAYQSHLSRLKYFNPNEVEINGRSGIYNMGRNFALKLVYSY